jgi:hypothetical protein
VAGASCGVLLRKLKRKNNVQIFFVFSVKERKRNLMYIPIIHKSFSYYDLINIMESEHISKCKLVRLRLDPEERCFLVYEGGASCKALKNVSKIEEAENGSGFWRRVLRVLSEATGGKAEKG